AVVPRGQRRVAHAVFAVDPFTERREQGVEGGAFSVGVLDGDQPAVDDDGAAVGDDVRRAAAADHVDRAGGATGQRIGRRHARDVVAFDGGDDLDHGGD